MGHVPRTQDGSPKFHNPQSFRYLSMLLCVCVFICLFVCLFVCLLEENKEIVEKNVKKKNWNVWYEATIVNRSKKVYCYISPRVCRCHIHHMMIMWLSCDNLRCYLICLTPSSATPSEGIFHEIDSH